MIYLFKHPNCFKKPRFKIGDKVWIIEDELQESGEYIDKVKLAEVTNVKPYWDYWYLIDVTLFNKRMHFIKYWQQNDSYTLETKTLHRVTFTDYEIFSTEKEANEWFNANY